MSSWDRLALANIEKSREGLTPVVRKRIAAAADPKIRYEGTVYEGRKLRTDEWVTLRIGDFEALAKAAGL